MRYAARTNAGRVRSLNEDATISPALKPDALVMVADGMGGHQAGEGPAPWRSDRRGSGAQVPAGAPRRRGAAGARLWSRPTAPSTSRPKSTRSKKRHGYYHHHGPGKRQLITGHVGDSRGCPDYRWRHRAGHPRSPRWRRCSRRASSPGEEADRTLAATRSPAPWAPSPALL